MSVFFVISNNILMFNYFFFFPAKTPIFPGSSTTSLEHFLKAIWEAVFWTLFLSKGPE